MSILSVLNSNSPNGFQLAPGLYLQPREALDGRLEVGMKGFTLLDYGFIPLTFGSGIMAITGYFSTCIQSILMGITHPRYEIEDFTTEQNRKVFRSVLRSARDIARDFGKIDERRLSEANLYDITEREIGWSILEAAIGHSLKRLDQLMDSYQGLQWSFLRNLYDFFEQTVAPLVLDASISHKMLAERVLQTTNVGQELLELSIISKRSLGEMLPFALPVNY